MLTALSTWSSATAQQTEGDTLGKNLTLRVYDVRDLVPTPRPRAPGPRLVLTMPSGETVGAPPGSEAADEPRGFVRRLADQLSTFVRPPLTGEATVSPVGGSHLTAIASPAQHAWIENCLKRHRDNDDQPLQLDTSVYSLTDATWKRLGLGDEPRPMTAAQWQAFEKSLQGEDGNPAEGIDMLSAPSLVCLPLSEVSIMATTQTSYLADFEIHELEVGGERQVIADPVVQVARSGIWLEGSMLLADDGTIGFDFNFRQVDLEQPIPTAEIRLEGIDKPFTIQRPTLHELEVQARATAAPGSSIAFPSPESVNGRRILLVLLPGRVAAERPRTTGGESQQQGDKQPQTDDRAPTTIQQGGRRRR
jgi:hypothetical protein